MDALEHVVRYAEVVDRRSCEILKEILETQWYQTQGTILELKAAMVPADEFQAKLDALSEALKRLNARLSELKSSS
jgi:hypothetical protein